MSDEANIHNLITFFTVPSGSDAFIDDNIQQSGNNANDFSSIVTYSLVDGSSNSTDWAVSINQGSGIFNTENEIINVYPNPSNGIFTIETNDNYEVLITDVTGNIITQISMNNKKSSIDINNQASGIYFIHFRNNKTARTAKIVLK